MNPIGRRGFLLRSGASAFALAAAPLLRFGEDESSKAKSLVIVEWNGGNDGLNTLIPFADASYYAARPTLSVARDQVLKLDEHYGLHPALAPLMPQWTKKRMALLRGVGYPKPDRSHFKSMDIWQSARLDGQRKSGWLGRAAAIATKKGRPLSLVHVGEGEAPLALRGPGPSATSIASLEAFKLRGPTPDLESRDSAGSKLDFLKSATEDALAQESCLASLGKKSGGRYPDSNLGKSLKLVSQLLQSGSHGVFWLRQSGFDTHAGQEQSHPLLMQSFAGAVAAFLKDLESTGQDEAVSLMAFSEFGRRVKENASLGTDHGAAGPVLMIGPNLVAGLHGPSDDLEDLVDGDLRYSIDFRNLLRETLRGGLGRDDLFGAVDGGSMPLRLFR